MWLGMSAESSDKRDDSVYNTCRNMLDTDDLISRDFKVWFDHQFNMTFDLDN